MTIEEGDCRILVAATTVAARVQVAARRPWGGLERQGNTPKNPVD